MHIILGVVCSSGTCACEDLRAASPSVNGVCRFLCLILADWASSHPLGLLKASCLLKVLV